MAEEDSLSDSLDDAELANVSVGSSTDDEEEGTVMMRGRVDYKAQAPNQLSFKRGDKIRMLEATEGEWRKGRLESTFEEGLVPIGYVVPAAYYYEEEDAAPALDTSGGGLVEEAEVEQVVKCLVDFVSKDPSYLSFKAHDRLDVINSSDAKFFKCKLNGKIGLVAREKVAQDTGYTLRRAADKKAAAKGQFRATRALEEKKVSSARAAAAQNTKPDDLHVVEMERERLLKQRELLKEEQAAKKEQRQARQQLSFADRVAQKQRSASMGKLDYQGTKTPSPVKEEPAPVKIDPNAPPSLVTPQGAPVRTAREEEQARVLAAAKKAKAEQEANFLRSRSISGDGVRKK